MLVTAARRRRVRPRPSASSSDVRLRMQRTRQRDTPAELALRSALHRSGLRFRIDCRPLAGVPRKADVVFRRARVAIFVDGCFWHGCPEHGTWPKINAQWWRTKIEGNRRRDRETNETLIREGWIVVRLWSHQDLAAGARRIASIVKQRTNKILSY
jgi:DNA mismatch endonuclease, patch repair protein